METWANLSHPQHHLLHSGSQHPSLSLAWPQHRRGICRQWGLAKPLGKEHQERKTQILFSLLCFLTNFNDRSLTTTELDPFHSIKEESVKHINLEADPPSLLLTWKQPKKSDGLWHLQGIRANSAKPLNTAASSYFHQRGCPWCEVSQEPMGLLLHGWAEWGIWSRRVRLD